MYQKVVSALIRKQGKRVARMKEGEVLKRAVKKASLRKRPPQWLKAREQVTWTQRSVSRAAGLGQRRLAPTHSFCPRSLTHSAWHIAELQK